ncbi:hypothetical protein Sjap_003585 [Stephania japonica]|uniref:FBD domain-containing protein n=1 Tax=Stephania japonica TaxID=461633 RepID=A0AAP0KRP5_9MAGN
MTNGLMWIFVGWVNQVAFEPCVVSKCQSLQFRNLKHLNLSTWLSRDCVFTIIEMLRMSPKIETMVLRIIEDGGKPLNWDEGMIPSAKVGEDQWLLEQCAFHHLKVLEIYNVIGCMTELKLLAAVLKSATTLEKMVIRTLCGMKFDTKKGLINFGKTLATIPRASSNVLILFF